MPFHAVLDPNRAVEMPSKICALGVMTKAPEPGKVKTRLTPPLTPEEAAQLNSCFLRDLSRSISLACHQANSRGVAVYTPIGAEAVYENILLPDFFLLPQRGNSFGERLLFAAKDLFRVGFESICLINSDSPTVSPSTFVEAANELAKLGDRVVLGPSADGGYYLIGMKKLHVRLFEEIDWSTERVFEQTKRRAAQLALDVCELPVGFDIDDPASLARLCDDLVSKNARGDVAPNTRKFLSEIIEREGRKRIWPAP